MDSSLPFSTAAAAGFSSAAGVSTAAAASFLRASVVVSSTSFSTTGVSLEIEKNGIFRYIFEFLIFLKIKFVTFLKIKSILFVCLCESVPKRGRYPPVTLKMTPFIHTTTNLFTTMRNSEIIEDEITYYIRVC